VTASSTAFALAFALENAAWPALLVDKEGRIRASSLGARELFGPVIFAQPHLTQAFWAQENSQTAEDYLASPSSAQPAGICLRSRHGTSELFHALLCPIEASGEKFILLQAHRPFEAKEKAPAPVSTAPASLEPGSAHRQKLDCALQLIRTVSLDFNNALTGILGHASHLLGQIDAQHPLRHSLTAIEKSAQRAAEIAADLSAFSRQDKEPKSPSSDNLNDLLRRTVEIFKPKQPDTVYWEVDLQSRPFAAAFDEAKMQQAFLKLLENAVEAMEGFGKICLRTRNLELAQLRQDGAVQLSPGSYVCVEISDTGGGIPPEVLPRVFEPFFTTKGSAGHRGLGLAWVYGIVTNHSGSVAITSEPGKGASVRVYLPALKKAAQDQPADAADLRGTETILMIDDEDLMLTMGEVVLGSSGYTVLTASSGASGLEIYKAKAPEIALVLTDLVMPQMSGRELIDQLRLISPSVKILCMSGFVRPASDPGSANYLQKPFASQELLRKVKQTLSANIG